MKGVLIDTNILLDLASDDELWAGPSSQKLNELAREFALYINDIVYAELCGGFHSTMELDTFLNLIEVELLPMSRGGLYLAAQAFKTYRRRGGTRTGVLPDFFIGAHAEVERLPLLTRDHGRYNTYFPAVELITP